MSRFSLGDFRPIHSKYNCNLGKENRYSSWLDPRQAAEKAIIVIKIDAISQIEAQFWKLY